MGFVEVVSALPDAKAHTTHAFVFHPFVLAFLVRVSLPTLMRLMSEAQSLRPHSKSRLVTTK